MANRGLFPIYDRLLDGKLGPILVAWRAQDPPLSFEEMAARLRYEHEVVVTSETVRRWYLQLAGEAA